MKRPGWLLAGLLGLVGCSGPAARANPDAPQPAPAGQAPMNVVMILSDDHSWDDYGFMGHPVVQTPNIDALAAQSVVYTRAYNPVALCRPSLATMVTGLYPHEHGITGNDPPGGRATMMDPAARAAMADLFGRSRTLVEILRDRGYLTFQTGKWWEGDPKEHGFTAAMTHGDPTRGGRHGDVGLRIGREAGMQQVREYIDSAGDRPFFLWYAPMLPHQPHNPPARLLAKYEGRVRNPVEAKYYAMTELFDETVGELLDHLDQRGLAGNTMIVYVADNGWEAMTDSGQVETDTRAKMSHYDLGTRTPVMIRMPGRVDPDRDDVSLVSTIDLAPTILRAVGVEPPSVMRGIDLVRDRAALADRQFVFGELFVHTALDLERPVANLISRTVLRKDGWKLILPHLPNRDAALTIQGTRPGWLSVEPELYNVRDDPFETVNRAAQRPDLVAELRSQIDRWWSVAE